jgi:ABC-type hemin transport system substrate-binding protein
MDIGAAAAAAAGHPGKSIAVVVDRSPDALEKLFVAGGGSLPDDLMVATGMRNVFGGHKRLYPMVSLESILVANPQVIVDLRPLARSPAGARDKALRLWRDSGVLAPAGPVEDVLVLEAADFTVVGPRVGAAARLLVESVLGVGPA